ncbi:hypothetical protein MX015_02880 [Streptococcus uberis]|nr:hypothetical protein [Streptococcus uberis]
MDCSSAVSKALGISMTNNTETLQQALPAIGYGKIHDAVDGVFDMQAYDVIIWAPRDGSSSLGSFGHVLIATSPTTAIHCNYGSDGITENDYNYIWNLNGRLERLFPEKVLLNLKQQLHLNLIKSLMLTLA